jgi:hypothetical protein
MRILQIKNKFLLVEPFNFNGYRNVSIKIYPDSRPHILEIASLQKGLVLVADGKELIGEGVGFGVPVVKYSDKTFFSSTAETSVDEGGDPLVVTKSFFMDTISKKRFEKGPFINDRVYRLLHTSFEKVYLGYRNFRSAFDKMMELRDALGIQTQFVEVEPRGKVDVKYKFFPEVIEVEVNFGNLDSRGIKELLVLNEQSSTFFRNYFDTDGHKLYGKNIGAWEQVKAEKASFANSTRSVVFTLKNVGGARLYRGWEQVNRRFCWAGLSYSLDPDTVSFTYPVMLR